MRDGQQRVGLPQIIALAVSLPSPASIRREFAQKGKPTVAGFRDWRRLPA